MTHLGLAPEIQDAPGLQGLLALGQIDGQPLLGQHAGQVIGGDAHPRAGSGGFFHPAPPLHEHEIGRVVAHLDDAPGLLHHGANR